ncbi:class I SAM-dependent methyltransferase [Luteococcus sediminum]
MTPAHSSLHTPEGAVALEAAMREDDPASLAAASRLRTIAAPALAAEALAQASLRRRARTKFGDQASTLFLTADGLEQATRPVVSRWRAERLRSEGVTRVVDLGCGIGADSLACLEVGLDVVAVELDPVTAEHARANLSGARVIEGDAVALASELLAGAGPETCAFVDPARRTERGRTWDVAAFTPPWAFVMDLLAGRHSTVVKLGPGVPRNLVPGEVEALWMADGHDVVECSLWKTPQAKAGRAALLLPQGLRVEAAGRELDVAAPGRHLIEANGAVTRAGALDALSEGTWLLDAEVAYLSSDEPVTHPGATCFEVLDELPFNPKVLKAWVREHRVGTLEIKKRAVDVDPAQLRKQLQPKGPNQATLVITPTVDGTRVLACKRLTP